MRAHQHGEQRLVSVEDTLMVRKLQASSRSNGIAYGSVVRFRATFMKSNGRVLKLASITSLDSDSWLSNRLQACKSVLKFRGWRVLSCAVSIRGRSTSHWDQRLAAPDESAPRVDDSVDVRVLWVTS